MTEIINTASYIVIFDGENSELFDEIVRPYLDENWLLHAFNGVDDLGSVVLKSQIDLNVVIWLGDKDLYDLIPYASEHHWTVGFLPHPDMNRFYRAFPVPKKVEEALEDITATEQPVLSDLLFCNSRLVLGSVMLGNPNMMRPASNIDNNLWSKLKYLSVMSFSLSRSSLVPFKLQTEKGSIVHTAALGITIVYRPSSSDFTKKVIGEAQSDQSTLNAIVLAPRSISEVAKFLFSRLFPNKEGSQGLASYIGHIKTKTIDVSGKETLLFTIDAVEYRAENVEVWVKPDALKVKSCRLPVKESIKEIKESICVSTLPKGQSVKELIERPLPWIHHVDQEEVKETFVNLKENAQTSQSYLVLMVLSTLLATIGLFANSAPVIIGAMILAPLMAPIVSLSMGVLRQNWDLIFSSTKTLSIGITLALVFGVLMTLITPLQEINSEIGARLSPTILDLAVAIVSGVAAAYASARSEVAKSLAGVAIAVALVPPLGVSAIGIGWFSWEIFSSAFLLFITNLFGIVLAAALTFLVMGFSPFHLAKKGVAYAFGFVILVSIPLSFAFDKLVTQQAIVSSLEGWQSNGIELKDVEIRSQNPLYISVTLLSDEVINTQDIAQTKQDIEKRLGRAVKLEATTAIILE